MTQNGLFILIVAWRPSVDRAKHNLDIVSFHTVGCRYVILADCMAIDDEIAYILQPE